MSRVTGAVIICSVMDQHTVDRINFRLHALGIIGLLTELDTAAKYLLGKHPEVSIYAVGFNYLESKEHIITVFQSMSWVEPEHALMYIGDPDDAPPIVVMGRRSPDRLGQLIEENARLVKECQDLRTQIETANKELEKTEWLFDQMRGGT